MSVSAADIERLAEVASEEALKALRPRIRQFWQEARSEPRKRALAHTHDTDDPQPVVVLDLNKTITPWTAYPMGEAEPYPGVKPVLDKFAARGVCFHIATAGLWPEVIAVPAIYRVRKLAIVAFNHRHGLPIRFIAPKVGADIYWDDRMIPVPAKVDWKDTGEQLEESLGKRFKLVKGRYQRVPKNPVGTEIQDFPSLDEIPVDQPRGYSTPILDIDVHRTLTRASGSTVTAPFNPDVVEAVRWLYHHLFTIHYSCAGWNPATHPTQDWQDRLAGLRWQVQTAGSPYDLFVSKDHGDVFIDDKGVAFTGDVGADMKLILPRLKARLGKGDVGNIGDEYRPSSGPVGDNRAPFTAN